MKNGDHLKKVLFLCTGNSCRSQMAEAIVNTQVNSEWKAFSAGTDPAGYVHPLATQVLEEIGLHYQGVSKHIDSLQDLSFDLVVTVCDDAAENCPLWLGSGEIIHFGFTDPVQAKGSEEQILTVFRQVRDEISEFIADYLFNSLE
jgi:arsenate reductase